jgi:hypothetical protein
MPSPFLRKLQDLASGPQGRKVVDEAKRLARDPDTRRKIDDARRKLMNRGGGGGGRTH